MSAKNEILDEAISTIRAAGFTPQVTCNGHWKVRTDQHGRPQRLIVSSSPSDRRAGRKVRAQLRRLLRDDGRA
jgi:hypothetical protein